MLCCVIPMGNQTYLVMHAKDVPEGTLRNILKQAGVTMEEFKYL
jgi:predicted RNA binding protein YcfA (HicA-like mRNA interferase family)